jgi:hypothetical protein
MTRAEIFANAYAQDVPDKTAHLYTDGCVLGLAVSVGREQQLMGVLKKHFKEIETARSKDGMYIAVVVPGMDADRPMHKAILHVMTDNYCDHRHEHYRLVAQDGSAPDENISADTIDWGAKIMAPLAEHES